MSLPGLQLQRDPAETDGIVLPAILDLRAVQLGAQLVRSRPSGSLALFGTRNDSLRQHAAAIAAMAMCSKQAGQEQTDTIHLPAPDCTCHNCMLLAAGTHPDVLEYWEPTETLKIETARNIKSTLQVTNFMSDRRIIILHQLDNITIEAANALLKALEEPPAGTWFIVSTENFGGLLPTIRSRLMPLRVQVAWPEGWQQAGAADAEPLARALGPVDDFTPLLSPEAGALAAYLVRTASPGGGFVPVQVQKELRPLLPKGPQLAALLEALAVYWTRSIANPGAGAVDTARAMPYNIAVPPQVDDVLVCALANGLCGAADAIRRNQNAGLVLEAWLMEARKQLHLGSN